MRPLLVTLGALGALGLAVGLGCALLIHGLPRAVVGRFGWFGFTSGTLEPGGFAVRITLNWLPSVLVLPGIGLLTGLVLAALLARLGWRLTKPATS